MPTRRKHAAHDRRASSAAHGTQPSSSWADDSWRVVLELKKSKLDIERAQEVQRKQDMVAAARKQRLLAAASKVRTQAKIDKQTKKLVVEATCDAIEYHKVLDNVERQTKVKYIRHLREHERTTRFLRTGHRHKWTKGAWLGPGPHPTTVYATPPTVIPFVYDVHGRRHEVDRAADVASQSLFDAAMTKIQREAAKAGKHLVAYFQRYDADRSGTLTVEEFRAALADLHVAVTGDQVDELFAYFDRNHTGAIDYGEFLWCFFNRRAYMKQWKATTSRVSVSALKQVFYKHDSRRKGAITSRDFLVAMKELGFAFSPMDEALIVHKFDANSDGFIDFDEFYEAFTQTHEATAVEKAPTQLKRHASATTGGRTKDASIMSQLDDLVQVQSRIHNMLKL
ncbi:hypothetical protein H310_10933 [Aphanomyces invadans]|uniref:EF-hand domain-containing protein n=1 Tax=Aphanomyces invadans TaxID=157072 RepID=A0A024TP55_9STRA|nr:hypothetical protein H310_10933 [Aphanomyces invadans]ETV95895.1 hypothetical protein H310_10933 [Aphanomyces invadans]|eukprot:XP_008875646.1 hypothetical protein H310_10933 [Aphanomyces invadans]